MKRAWQQRWPLSAQNVTRNVLHFNPKCPRMNPARLAVARYVGRITLCFSTTGPVGCRIPLGRIRLHKGHNKQMAKRRGNPNWGKPEPIGPVVPTVTSFEQVVKEFKLTPDQYIRSTRLREWARRNKNSKYIPEALLEAWGFEIESTL
jgi:hypothetical protein